MPAARMPSFPWHGMVTRASHDPPSRTMMTRRLGCGLLLPVAPPDSFLKEPNTLLILIGLPHRHPHPHPYPRGGPLFHIPFPTAGSVEFSGHRWQAELPLRTGSFVAAPLSISDAHVIPSQCWTNRRSERRICSGLSRRKGIRLRRIHRQAFIQDAAWRGISNFPNCFAWKPPTLVEFPLVGCLIVVSRLFVIPMRLRQCVMNLTRSCRAHLRSSARTLGPARKCLGTPGICYEVTASRSIPKSFHIATKLTTTPTPHLTSIAQNGIFETWGAAIMEDLGWGY